MGKQGKLFVVSAASGAGKTSLVNAAIECLSKQKCQIQRIVTYTTKEPRMGDVQGRDYNFISVAEFNQKISEGFFIEWSQSYGHYYGSPRNILDDLSRGISLILIIDRTGARQVYSQIKDVTFIWIYTHNVNILRKRLIHRATEKIEEIEYRLALAQQETQEEAQESLYRYHILNDNFEKALGKIVFLVLHTLKKAS